MINDVIQSLKDGLPGTEVFLYADELVIWGTSSSIPALDEKANQALVDSFSGPNRMKCLSIQTNPSTTVL